MPTVSTPIPTAEATWLLALLNDHEVPRPRPVAPEQFEDRVAGLEATVRLLVSIIDPKEIAAAIRLQTLSIDNDQLIEWAKQCEPPLDLVGQAEERPW